MAAKLQIASRLTPMIHESKGLRPRPPETAGLAQITTAAAMGVGLIHEMSQPLSAVATFIHASRRLLNDGCLDRVFLAETMEKAEQELKRARDVLARLRDIVSGATVKRLPVNLFELTTTIADQLRDEAEARSVRIRIEPASLPVLVADTAQIEHVLLNLMNNAIDAAAETSNGVVSVRCCHDSATIKIEVDDNGNGIASEIAEHVFELFQTTKPHGMGLGLPLSQQIIEAHGGQLWWEPRTPQGTRFHLLLPFNGTARDDS